MNHRYACVTLLLCSALFAGCATTATIEATGRQGWNDEGAPVTSTNIDYNNSTLKSNLKIVSIDKSMANDLLRAQIRVKSDTSSVQQVQYQFEWFDARGTELMTGRSWKPLILQPYEVKSLQGVAPDPRAAEFKLKLRESE